MRTRNYKPEYVPNTLCKSGIYATFSGKNLALSGVPFFIVIDHKVNPVCDRIDRIRFESVLPRRGWHRE